MSLFYTKVSFIKQSMSLGIWINLPNIIYIHRGVCRKNFRGFPMVYIQITKQGGLGGTAPDAAELFILKQPLLPFFCVS